MLVQTGVAMQLMCTCNSSRKPTPETNSHWSVMGNHSFQNPSQDRRWLLRYGHDICIARQSAVAVTIVGAGPVPRLVSEGLAHRFLVHSV